MTVIAAVVRPSVHEIAATALLKRLPASAQRKFERLRQIEVRCRAFADGLLEQIELVREKKADAERQLGRLDRHHDGEFTYEEDKATGARRRIPFVYPERAGLLEKIEAAKAELKRLADDRKAAGAGFTTDDLLQWLTSQSPSTKFIEAKPRLSKLNKSETLADALARNREAQARVSAELTSARNARRTIAEAKSAMRAGVARIAEQGRPEVGGYFRGADCGWPTEPFVAGGLGAHEFVVATTVKNGFAFSIWSNREAVIAQLEAEIERTGDDTVALSAEAQATRIAECEAEMLDLQRAAEGIIERLEAEGQFVPRTCSHPLVLLGIERAPA